MFRALTGWSSRIGGRDHNEDSFIVAVKGGRGSVLNIADSVPFDLLLAVADGMGGGPYGELASDTVVRSLKALFVDGKYTDWIRARGMGSADPLTVLKDLVRFINGELVKTANSKAVTSIGTTADIVVVQGGNYYYAHVGDSRIYLISNSQVRQLTSDHNLGQAAKDARVPLDMVEKPNMVYNMLGVHTAFEIDVGEGTLSQGDVFLLASDGIAKLTNDDFAYHLRTNPQNMIAVAEGLTGDGVRRGGEKADNATAVLAKIGEDGDTASMARLPSISGAECSREAPLHDVKGVHIETSITDIIGGFTPGPSVASSGGWSKTLWIAGSIAGGIALIVLIVMGVVLAKSCHTPASSQKQPEQQVNTEDQTRITIASLTNRIAGGDIPPLQELVKRQNEIIGASSSEQRSHINQELLALTEQWEQGVDQLLKSYLNEAKTIVKVAKGAKPDSQTIGELEHKVNVFAEKFTNPLLKAKCPGRYTEWTNVLAQINTTLSPISNKEEQGLASNAVAEKYRLKIAELRKKAVSLKLGAQKREMAYEAAQTQYETLLLETETFPVGNLWQRERDALAQDVTDVYLTLTNWKSSIDDKNKIQQLEAKIEAAKKRPADSVTTMPSSRPSDPNAGIAQSGSSIDVKETRATGPVVLSIAANPAKTAQAEQGTNNTPVPPPIPNKHDAWTAQRKQIDEISTQIQGLQLNEKSRQVVMNSLIGKLKSVKSDVSPRYKAFYGRMEGNQELLYYINRLDEYAVGFPHLYDASEFAQGKKKWTTKYLEMEAEAIEEVCPTISSMKQLALTLRFLVEIRKAKEGAIESVSCEQDDGLVKLLKKTSARDKAEKLALEPEMRLWFSELNDGHVAWNEAGKKQIKPGTKCKVPIPQTDIKVFDEKSIAALSAYIRSKFDKSIGWDNNLARGVVCDLLRKGCEEGRLVFYESKELKMLRDTLTDQ